MGRVGFTIAIAGMVALCASAESARGQCEYEWKPGGSVPGIDGVVSTTIHFDPDGGGPLPDMLVVGGTFRAANRTLVNNIAAWDGAVWHAFGSGILGPAVLGSDTNVRALAIYNGELIAGGNFTLAGGQPVSNVARWDGASWQPLGTGIAGATGVYSLSVYGSYLVAGGNFTSAGGVAVNHIARWNGTSWLALGSGVTGGVPIVYALREFAGDLVVGGTFSNAGGLFAVGLARWNGSAWLVFGNGNVGNVYCMGEYATDLVIAGQFSTPGGFTARNIARWNRINFQPIGPGLNQPVRSVQLNNGILYVGGGNSLVLTPNRADGIARWDGSNWLPVGSGLNSVSVCTLASFDGNLIAVGDFETAGGSIAHHIARWDGAAWNPFHTGFNGAVHSLEEFKNELSVCGGYGATPGLNNGRFAKWRETEPWVQYGNGVGGVGYSYTSAVGRLGTDLVLGGYYTNAGGTYVNSIAAWNGTSWRSLGGLIYYNQGFPALATVYDIEKYGNKLVIGGNFTQAGAITANRVVSWDAQGFTVLGSGMNNTVYALTQFQGEIVAGGSFTQAGGVSCNRIARWDGAAWQPLGGGMNESVYALIEFNADLLAGGTFTAADGMPASRLARWNGTNWQALGSEVTGTNVRCFYVDGNSLYVGGLFSTAGGVPANNIAVWDGATWEPVIGGTNEQVLALSRHDGDLFVGGQFSAAGGEVSNFFARYGSIGPKPVIVEQPASANSCADLNVSLSVAATGDGVLSYRWRKSGIELVDGGEMMGAQTNTLVFVHAGVADAGEYDCVVKLNDCTQATSNIATLTVYPTNTADGNGDAVVDGRDVRGMVDALVGFSPVSAALCAYELNGDGIVSEADVDAFVGRVLTD